MSGNLPITTIFFDLDDTLYPASSGLWGQIKNRIGYFMRDQLHIPEADIPTLRRALFEQYGTTLRGLQASYDVNVTDFLAYVHDIPLADYIHPDPQQREVIRSLPGRKFILTNADVNHARRVLRVLQLEEFFSGIIDVVAFDPYCKPMPQAFQIALELTGSPDPGECAVIDDIARTTLAAREQGMFAILYGSLDARSSADAAFVDWADLPGLLNGRHHAS